MSLVLFFKFTTSDNAFPAFSLAETRLTSIIFPSKYFSVSDWVKSTSKIRQPASVDQIWKAFTKSNKMTSSVQDNKGKRHENRETLATIG